MKNLARGSVLLGLIVLTGFYFQYKAEAVTIANDSQENIKQENIEKDKINNQIFEITDAQDSNLSETFNIENNNSSFKILNGQSFRATAYCLKGRTALGTSVRRGIVAADPRVLPLGTRINVNAGSYSGTYLVADTGGAVRGRILDIWVPSCSEANRFGRKTVQVSVAGRRTD